MRYKIPYTNDVFEIAFASGNYKTFVLHFPFNYYDIVFRNNAQYMTDGGNIILCSYNNNSNIVDRTEILMNNPFDDYNFQKKADLVQVELYKSQTFRIPCESEIELDYSAICVKEIIPEDVGSHILKTYFMLINHKKYPVNDNMRYCIMIRQMLNDQNRVVMNKDIHMCMYKLSD